MPEARKTKARRPRTHGQASAGRATKETQAIQAKRIYEPRAADDGARVLVDRLWPRGIARAKAGLDAWEKDAAPSTVLRRWYGHRAERHEEFERRFRAELASEVGAAALERLRERARSGPLTLLTATRDLPLSHAALLVRMLERSHD